MSDVDEYRDGVLALKECARAIWSVSAAMPGVQREDLRAIGGTIRQMAERFERLAPERGKEGGASCTS